MGFKFSDYDEIVLQKKINSKIIELNKKENPEFITCVKKAEELILRDNSVPTPRVLREILGSKVHKVTELCRSKEIAYECVIKQAKINLGMIEPIRLKESSRRPDKQARKKQPVEMDMPPHLLMNKLLKIYEDDGIITLRNLGDHNFNRANLEALYKKFGCKSILELEEIVRTEYVFYQLKKEQTQEQTQSEDVAGVVNREIRGWTSKEVRKVISDYYKSYRKLPSSRWLGSTPGVPCAETVKRYLGRDREDWLRVIGVDPGKDVCKNY